MASWEAQARPLGISAPGAFSPHFSPQCFLAEVDQFAASSCLKTCSHLASCITINACPTVNRIKFLLPSCAGEPEDSAPGPEKGNALVKSSQEEGGDFRRTPSEPRGAWNQQHRDRLWTLGHGEAQRRGRNAVKSTEKWQPEGYR